MRIVKLYCHTIKGRKTKLLNVIPRIIDSYFQNFIFIIIAIMTYVQPL